ncbi:MAG TPA: nucleotide disphospho-sugar-binding domain-containing protein [Thermoanaerobaculia bacterium]|nr:nucleotide disphospho-sugar-binding domain-containing protein [Thermoanaerobaculia bacterium]
MIGIARALRELGHEVAFATGPASAGFLAAEGLDRIPRGEDDGASFQVKHWFQPLSVAIQIKHIEYALSRFPADALIGQQLTFGPLIVRERRRLPVGLLGFCTYLWPASDELARKQDLSPFEARLVWRHQDMLGWLNKTRQMLRLPLYEGGCRETPFLADLFLVRGVPELQPDEHLLPGQVHLVGSCLWEPETIDPELAAWLRRTAAPEATVIYAQPGRAFEAPCFWSGLVEALAGSKYRVVASVGRLDREVGNLPDTFFVRPHVNQGQVLSTARAVVSSATTTAVLGALTAGLPSLLIPTGSEQPDVAEVCANAGAALALTPEEVTPARVREVLDELLKTPSYRERAASLQSAFTRFDSFQLAADLCERLAESRGPVLRSPTLGGILRRTSPTPEPLATPPSP